MTNRPRLLDNGHLVYPVRGDPPPDTPGYVRNPGNPYEFFPIWPPCKFRAVGDKPCNCPNNVPLKFYTCKLDIQIIGDTCRQCPSRIEPDEIAVFREAWRQIHTEKQPTIQRIKAIVNGLPCSECILHGNAYVDANPWGTNRLNKDYFAWSVAFHNSVNTRIGKVEISIAEAKKIWLISN